MFTRLGQLSVRRHRLVLALSAIFLVLAGVLGTGVFSQLSTGGFDDPTSESVRADRVLAEQFHTGAPNLIFLVDVDRRATASASDVPAVDAADVSAEADRVLRRLRADPAINEAVSYWSLGNVAPLRNRDGDAAMIAAHIAGDDDADLRGHHASGRRARGDARSDHALRLRSWSRLPRGVDEHRG